MGVERDVLLLVDVLTSYTGPAQWQAKTFQLCPFISDLEWDGLALVVPARQRPTASSTTDLAGETSRQNVLWVAVCEVAWNGLRNAFAPAVLSLSKHFLAPDLAASEGLGSLHASSWCTTSRAVRVSCLTSNPSHLTDEGQHTEVVFQRTAVTLCPWEPLGALRRFLDITFSWGPTLACQCRGIWIAENSY